MAALPLKETTAPRLPGKIIISLGETAHINRATSTLMKLAVAAQGACKAVPKGAPET